MDHKELFLAQESIADKALNKWQKVINAAGEIKDHKIAKATALVLENTHNEFVEKGLISESYAGGMGAQAGGAGQGGGVFGSTYDFGQNDARIPSIIIPTVRRIFPDLLAHECVGVQPMNGPVGFAFAFRAKYDTNGQFSGTDGTNAANGLEVGYNNIDTTFTGASGNSVSGSMWDSFAGTGGNGLYGNKVYMDGAAAGLSTTEWAAVGTNMPMAKFSFEKSIVEAKERKLASKWSLELQEDMKKMHGVDADQEMTNIISYEVQQEIDRQLLTEMVKAAITGGRTSVWTPVSADGRNQMERIGTLYTQILDKKQEVAIRTRRGAANFMIASPKVCALVERFQDFVNWNGSETSKVDVGVAGGVSKVGTLKSGIKVFRDTFAGGNYVLLGYKGAEQYDAGIIYCPYIPLSLMRAIDPTTFAPILGARTRYGILSHLFGASNYYHFMKISDLTSAALSDSSKIFMA